MPSKVTIHDNAYSGLLLRKCVPSDTSDQELDGIAADLSVISGVPVHKLAEDYPGLLVYPSSLDEYGDNVSDQTLCRLSFSDGKNYLHTGLMMGFVGVGNTMLKIQSRFDSDANDFFLHHMLRTVFCPNLVDMQYSQDDDSVFDFLIYLFPYYLNRAMSQGLYKEYQTHKYNDIKIRGTIDISRHIKHNIPFTGNVAYRVREYYYDNHITQLIRHTIEYIKTTSFGSRLFEDGETHDNIRLIVENTPTYSKHNRMKVLGENVRDIHHPYLSHYSELQSLCRRILRHEEIKYGDNDDRVYGIIFDGAWLWEEYVARILENEFAHHTRKNPTKLFIDENGKKHQPIIPDYVSRDGSLVADAKYIPLDKNEGSYNEERANAIYYKTITYMLRFQTKDGLLLYPSRASRRDDWTIIDTQHRLIKVSLSIPEGASDYADFGSKMNESVAEFRNKIFEI